MNGRQLMILEKKNNIYGSSENIKFLNGFLFIFWYFALYNFIFLFCVKIKKRKIRMKRRVKTLGTKFL